MVSEVKMGGALQRAEGCRQIFAMATYTAIIKTTSVESNPLVDISLVTYENTAIFENGKPGRYEMVPQKASSILMTLEIAEKLRNQLTAQLEQIKARGSDTPST